MVYSPLYLGINKDIMKLIQINFKSAVARLIGMALLSSSLIMYSCADRRSGEERYEDPKGDDLVSSEGDKDSFGMVPFKRESPGPGAYGYGSADSDREGHDNYSGTGVMGSGTHGETETGGTHTRKEDGLTTEEHQTSTSSDSKADTLTRPGYKKE